MKNTIWELIVGKFRISFVIKQHLHTKFDEVFSERIKSLYYTITKEPFIRPCKVFGSSTAG